MQKRILVKNQKKNINVTVKNSKLYPEFNGKTLKIQIRYDDECGNGHNYFSITGSCGGNYGISGCIHDFIVEQKPDLKKYLKWHLMGSDQPMHYIANTMYHVKKVKKNTIVRHYDKVLKFENYPFTFKLTKEIKEFLNTYKTGKKIKIYTLPYDGSDSYNFSDNYTFIKPKKDATKKWYNNMFNDENKALEFKQALENIPFEIVKTISSYEDEKKPGLKAARNSAIWANARLSDFTEEKLKARLPKLLKDFKKDIEKIGFIY